ncbi:hypothetical protein H1230_18870 [Paenibacillus sp. 19GGS1-52]|uniref:hypothetical protein n=1 Tax=Paenibacillus sp. 19GGS1-52 TaxID=2758563 RepID=UPI001EFAD4F1|nr:hypothetical protein [Paenibacillus sp. 19GGS1-52]ULO05173.1 hypothetical protein H1230_18870 [Paenibacillus sp. 19GGS1-52]
MDEKLELDEIKRFLSKREEILAVPTKGGDFATIRGDEITDLKVHENGSLIAMTNFGEYFIIPSYNNVDETMEYSPFPDFLKRISEHDLANITQVSDVDYENKRITFIGGGQKSISEEYWIDFINSYEKRLLH